ncbi:UNVERIFIED_CONTAM: putative disease resistance RPP13-like protein 2 [Sesamum latifolium]|uniref:Disease resistance RPP13-like protein 2 n=1 Tax=Sesamum latifolium TaxID=2727402 RepID=A0AAW2XZC7_9LAMI
MAVDAVASVILQKLRDLLLEESFTNNRVIGSQLKEMQEALESMRGYFIDAADKETDFGDIKKWTDDYLHHLYDVEDSIESFALRITRQRKRLGFLMNRALFLKKFTACKMLSRKLEKIQRRIKELSDRTPAGLEDASLRSIRSQRSNFSLGWWADVNGAAEKYEEDEDHKDEEDEESGLDLNPFVEIDDLISIRRHSISSSIVTTTESPRSLLRSLSFDLRSLVREASLIRERWEQSKLMYSYSYDEEKLSIVGYEREVPALLNRLTKEDDCDDRIITVVGELGSGKTMLARAVYGNRIVMNWFKGSCAWVTIFKDSTTKDILLNLLNQGEKSKEQDSRNEEKFLKREARRRDEQNGSKIIITTCDEQLGLLARQPHSLKELGHKESWDLFLRKVGLKEDPDNSTLKDRIIEVCGGLPLNIVLLGSLLSTKKDKGIKEWPSILDNQEKWSTSDILMFSYNDLDAHLKLCLLYMMLFPKELDIPVRRLQRLWLAEGVLHDFLLTKVRGISLFHIHQGSVCNKDGPFGKRRLIEYADGKNCSLTPSEYQCLRSYISFNFQKKDTPAKDVAKLLSHMIGKGLGLLRVLDLEGVYKPSLPDNLGDLFHLRYLGLRWTFLDKLPKSVGELSYLETLDLKHTYINGIPPSIWKLKHLRHLSLNEIHLNKDMPLHSHTGSLPKLLTLWGLSVDQDSPIKNGLSKLTDLRELGITFRLSKCDDKDSNGFSNTPQFMQDLVEWISKLTNLQSLRLRSKDDSGRPADLSLKPFSGLNKLSHMNLLGRLQKLPEIDHFPPNIKVLTLSVSQLDEDPMPVLGQLPSLTVLRLLANSYLGEKIVCPRGTFEGLEVLKLWMLKDLKKWELEEGAMKKLKELNIRCCSKLENIPSRLLQQGTFKDLILTNMPEKFKQTVEMNNPRKVSITVKDYKFTPLPWEQADGTQNGTA